MILGLLFSSSVHKITFGKDHTIPGEHDRFGVGHRIEKAI